MIEGGKKDWSEEGRDRESRKGISRERVKRRKNRWNTRRDKEIESMR